MNILLNGKKNFLQYECHTAAGHQYNTEEKTAIFILNKIETYPKNKEIKTGSNIIVILN